MVVKNKIDGAVIKMDNKGDLRKIADSIDGDDHGVHDHNNDLARSHEELARSYAEKSSDIHQIKSEDASEMPAVSTHTHQQKKQVCNRLARAGGHLDKVKRMVEQDYDCMDVLIQLSAVIAALKKAGKVILDDHIQNCIVDAVRIGDDKAVEDLKKAIGRFIK